MINAGQSPSESVYHLQYKDAVNGSPNEWVIINLQFQDPHMIEVSVNGVVIPPVVNKNLQTVA